MARYVAAIRFKCKLYAYKDSGFVLKIRNLDLECSKGDRCKFGNRFQLNPWEAFLKMVSLGRIFNMNVVPDKRQLIELAHYRMPFGKFKGRYLVELPEPYLVWFQQSGFPEGKLGNLLRAMLEIKINGLEGLIRKIQKDFPQ